MRSALYIVAMAFLFITCSNADESDQPKKESQQSLTQKQVEFRKDKDFPKNNPRESLQLEEGDLLLAIGQNRNQGKAVVVMDDKFNASKETPPPRGEPVSEIIIREYENSPSCFCVWSGGDCDWYPPPPHCPHH